MEMGLEAYNMKHLQIIHRSKIGVTIRKELIKRKKIFCSIES
jgi:hypothetical protein